MVDAPVSLLIISVAAALISAVLAVEIYLRAKPQAEIRVLLITLALLCASLSLLAIDIAMHDIAHIWGARAHFIALRSRYFLRVCFFATGAHFLYLSARRLWPEGASPLSRRAGDFVIYTFCYGTAVVALGALVLFTIRQLMTEPASGLIISDLRGGIAPVIAGGVLGAYPGLWMAEQFSVLTYLHRALPERDRRSPISRFLFKARWYEWGYGQTDLPKPSLAVSPRSIKDEFNALVITALGAAGMFALTWASLILRWSERPRIGLGTVLEGVSPLLVLAPLVYYKCRFVFFDVLIKRGALVLLLLTFASVYFLLVIGPLARTAEYTTGFPARVVVALAGVLFVGVCSAAYVRVEREIDRLLFRRPDYSELLREIASGLKQFVDPEAMIGYVSEKLRLGIPSAYVHYLTAHSHGEAVSEPGSAGATAGTGNACLIPLVFDRQHFGTLEIGPRPRSQPYQSADVAFLETAAAHLAGMLRNVELRIERDRQESQEARLRELARKAELKALKAQINPHFLFNALNSLAHMAGDDPTAAGHAIADLASVFRFTLEAAGKDSVSLGEEADFIRAYLEIERIRFEDRLDYELSVPDNLKPARIPPMLIQPIVENAVKHGISPLIGRRGKIVITATPNRNRADMVDVTIEDNGIGFDPVPKSSGIGLSNVRTRVESIFGGRNWSLTSTPGTGTIIRLSFPRNGFPIAGEKPK
ncbi:MAG TPA: histidine kinase [Blastocatellia bacterium]|nr:histidine kinase [Blastocatellia bacterium]